MDEALIIAAQMNVLDYLILDWDWSNEQGVIHDDLLNYYDELNTALSYSLAKELEKRTMHIARPSKEYKNDRSF